MGSFAARGELPLGRHLRKRLAFFFRSTAASSEQQAQSQSGAGLARALGFRARVLRDFAAAYAAEREPLARLAQTGRLAAQIEDLHHLLDAALAAAHRAPEPVLLARWRYFWLRERRQRCQHFERLMENQDGLVPQSERAQLEAMTLLRDDVDRHGATVLLPEERELAQRAFELVARRAGAVVLSVPRWFTSPFDLAAKRRTWQHADDLVVQHLADPLTAVSEERCAATAHAWAALAHPFVARLRGACHVGAARFLVYERGASLLSTESEARRWRALCEAALALRYLHSRGAALDCLSCADVQLHGRHARLAVANLRLVGPSGPHGAARDSPWRLWSRWQWLAPERLQGGAPSAAADVFSLGMCALEAARGAAPWSSGGEDVPYQLGHRRVLAGELPPRPRALSDAQWGLVQRMCARDPTARPDMREVVLELQGFARQAERDERREVSGVDDGQGARVGRKRRRDARQQETALVPAAQSRS